MCREVGERGKVLKFMKLADKCAGGYCFILETHLYLKRLKLKNQLFARMNKGSGPQPRSCGTTAVGSLSRETQMTILERSL